MREVIARLIEAEGEAKRIVQEAESEADTCATFQRWLAASLIAELCELTAGLSGSARRLLEWMAVRHQLENLKVLLRGILSRTPLDALRRHLVDVPAELSLDEPAVMASSTWWEAASRLGQSPFAPWVARTFACHGAQPQPLLVEAKLDQSYFQELVTRADALPPADRVLVAPIVHQEVDVYHLALAARGKFHYGLGANVLAALHVGGTGISERRYRAMLAEVGLFAALGHGVGRVLDRIPTSPPAAADYPVATSPPALDALAWTRYLRLANRAFRRSHMGPTAVVGYVAIRRVEAITHRCRAQEGHHGSTV